MIRALAFSLAVFLAASAALSAEVTQPVLTGATNIHDPTVMVVDGSFVAYGTGDSTLNGGAVRAKWSADGSAWRPGGWIGNGIPAWVADAGVHPPELWAPSVSMHNGTAYLYYAASTWGSNVSAIGLATNAHLDPKKPGEGWVDQGLVLKTTIGDNFNAIDPARIDTPDGRAFLSLGSFWSGIKMRELDPVSGKLKEDNPTIYALANRYGGAIEASSVLHHGDWYYLFVSFDRCCAGLESTYRIMVGRSKDVTGPYVARDGTPMSKRGATEVEKTTGRYVGPGGQEVFVGPDGADWLAYHFYDRDVGGAPRLQIAPIRFDADGWPYLDPLPAN